MKKYNLTLRNFIELKGNLVYLKKLDKDNIKEYSQNLLNSSLETIVLTSTTQVFSQQSIERYVEEVSSDNSRVDFLIYAIESDKLVGEVVLNDIDRNNRNANMRIAIDQKEDFNKGYGSESVILALHYGFGMKNLHRIELEVLSINKRGIYVYEKIGFKKEGIKRDACFFNHRYYDLIIMSILEEEFRQKYQNSTGSIEELINS